MSSFNVDAAASVLPVTASAAVRPHDADLMPTTGWFGGSVKRIASGTSYDTQSRGSSG
jgi:hypothetical protein